MVRQDDAGLLGFCFFFNLLLFTLEFAQKWPPDCIRLLTSGQRCTNRWCQLRPIRSLLCRRGAGLRATCNSCLHRLRHQFSWIPQLGSHVLIALFSGSPTPGRDNVLPCFTGTSCQVSCLNNRRTPVMFQSRTIWPQNLHDCWLSLGDYESVGIFLYRRGKPTELNEDHNQPSHWLCTFRHLLWSTSLLITGNKTPTLEI